MFCEMEAGTVDRGPWMAVTGGATRVEADEDDEIRLMTNFTWDFSSPQAFHNFSIRDEPERGRSTPLHCSTRASWRLILRHVRSSDFSDLAGLES